MFLDALFDYTFEPVDVPVFFTLLLLEAVLSFDNAAILAAMVRKLPREQRRNALLYGLAGAYVFRTLAILSVAFIIQYPALKIAGGLYLLWLATRHFTKRGPHEVHAPSINLGFLRISPFWGVVIAVELADLAFALDQVLVAVAMTDKLLIIVVASLIAIVFLRVAAYYIGRLMDWFPPLESLAYVAVGWVGLKLISIEAAHLAGWTAFDIPKAVSVAVTLSVIVLPVLGKLALDLMRKRREPGA